MKKLILVLIIFSFGLLYADDLYFNNGVVWKNCELISRSGIMVKIVFNEKYDKISVIKNINKIHGIVLTDYDPESETLIRRATSAYISQVPGIVKIEDFKIQINHTEKYITQHEYLEMKNGEDIPRNYTKGLSNYSRKELLSISENSKALTKNDKILYYHSMKKNAVPEFFTNGYGISSMMQDDFGFGVFIFALELSGTILSYFSQRDDLRYLGYGMIGVGFVSGIIRPLVYADKYNQALKVALELNYEF